jgi:SSS family solute:Na+ symporter
VFPWFIVHKLPPGVSGLLVAAILAAAMSTISGTLNSGATVLLEDYRKRFAKTAPSERANIRFLRFATVGLGVFSMCIAFAVVNVQSVLTTWWALQSVLSGGMLGLFLLSFFSKRTTSAQAAVATALGILTVLWITFGGKMLGVPDLIHVNMAIVLGTTVLVASGFLSAAFVKRGP